jgi:hypothetical protein
LELCGEARHGRRGKLEAMLTDLEFSYSPVRQKVRELREYL